MKRKLKVLGLSIISAVTLVSCNKEELKQSVENKVVEENKPQKLHDEVTLLDSNNKAVPHNFKDGICTKCGITSLFDNGFVGEKDILKKESSKKGTVEKISYDTYAYAIDKKYNNTTLHKITKDAYVYLPYGYDKSTDEKYDILYLLHGSGLTENYWFAQGNNLPSDPQYVKGFGTQNVLDNMMEQGLCKKTIVVTPTLYSPLEGYEIGNNDVEIPANFGRELVNDLMPYMASNYKTYASSSSQEALKENRNHQAYAGLSLGSMTSFYIMNDYNDYFAYYGSYSGATYNHYDQSGLSVDTVINTLKNSDKKIKYWFSGVGTVDEPHYEYLFNDFVKMKNELSFSEGSDISKNNCEFVQVPKGGHNYAVWISCLYNSLKVFFK